MDRLLPWTSTQHEVHTKAAFPIIGGGGSKEIATVPGLPDGKKRQAGLD